MNVKRSARVAHPLSRAAAVVLGASLAGALPATARADDAAKPSVPAEATPPSLPARRLAPLPPAGSDGTMVHSPALAAGGYFFVAFGLASILGGAAATVAVSHSNCDVCGFGYFTTGAVIAHGAACLAAGIPMVVIGSRRIPVPTLMPLMVPSVRGTWAEKAAAPTGLALTGTF